MDVEEALRRRRMVRHHTGQPLPDAAMDRIASAVARAPTAGNTQGVSAILVTEPARIAAVADACGEADYRRRGFAPWLSSAAALLVLCVEPVRYAQRYAEADKDSAVLERVPWWWVDGGAALMAVLLAATGEGVAAGFLGGHRAGDARPLLGIPDEVEILGIATLGPAAADRPTASSQRPRRDDVVRREHW